MLTFTKYRSISLVQDFLDIFWEVTIDGGEAELDYDFYVLRSENNLEGPYKVIAGPLSGLYTFRDPDVFPYKRNIRLFYKVRAVRKSDNYDIETEPFDIEGPADLQTRAISDFHDVLLDNMGVGIIIYNRKSFGARCAECWDSIKHQQRFSHCKTCYDTGYAGGYLPPNTARMRAVPEQHQYTFTSQNKADVVETQMYLSRYPPVNLGDVIVEIKSNIRWKVRGVAKSEHIRHITMQHVGLHQIPESDIEYQLTADLDLSKIVYEEERIHTNPHSI
ncbi:hypothetical protein LCGC14_0146820 [marine sediment metagenome]|uniref:Uncharacterized protein n=1 Tax=marine sediment metagenome TaxID=412755 RepID=A0A0F9V025_9ZZZZ